MCSAEFTCGNGSGTIQSVSCEFLLTVNLWIFEQTFSRNNFSVYCLFIHLIICFNSGFYASDLTNLIYFTKNKWFRGAVVSESPARVDKPSFVLFLFIFIFNPIFLFACFPLFLLLTLNSLVRFLRERISNNLGFLCGYLWSFALFNWLFEKLIFG